MNRKRTRLFIRTSILIVLVCAVSFTLYQNYIKSNDLEISKGKAAPNFALKDTNGKKRSLGELEGKLILVNFWGTWCEPCKREMPAIETTYKNYHNKGFEVLAINLQESPYSISKFSKEYKITFPILRDNGDVSKIYNVSQIPASFFINPNGKIEKILEGEMSESQLEAIIEKHL